MGRRRLMNNVHTKKEKWGKRRQANCPLSQENDYGGSAPGIQG